MKFFCEARGAILKMFFRLLVDTKFKSEALIQTSAIEL